jgi:hypothetical protein
VSLNGKSRSFAFKILMVVVTPCFPQFVKITGLAKNYGKLINVNNIMNFIAGLLRGVVRKKRP